MQSAKQMTFHRSIPIREDVDIFIAGGGPAGIAAGVTAARQGKKVFLAEGQSFFGGMGTAALVPIFCYFTDLVNFISAGFGSEVYDRLWQAGGTGPDDRPDNPHGAVGIQVEVLKRVYDDMASGSGLGFSFQTHVIGVEHADDKITHAICYGKSGLFAIKARVFIDCTGDGDLAVWAGAPYEKGDEAGSLMPGTLCSLWADIDWQKVNQSGLNSTVELPRAFKDNVFTIPDPHLPGMYRVGKHTGGGNIGHLFGVDGTDERSMTSALIWGRKSVVEYETYYKNYLQGFEKMQLVATGGLPGIRETRRILGDYVLNLEDFKNRAIFADEIGRFSYPVDIHATRPDAENTAKFEQEFATLRYQPGESYGIPYRTLTPRGLTNLLVAGRCTSTDRYIQGSLRVMPGCYITGQAAGMAAALAVEGQTSTHAVPIGELLSRLQQIGAYLPNFK